MSLRRNAVRTALAVAVAAVAASAAPAARAETDPDPATCTQAIGYNANVPSWDTWFAAHPDPSAVLPFAAGAARSGGGAPAFGAGNPPTGRNLNSVLIEYWDALVNLTASDAKDAAGHYVFPFQMIKKPLGESALGRPINFYVVGTREHIASLDTASGDAQFWRGVREGAITADEGLEAVHSRPAFAWLTATPHGAESAAGESITRQAYELLARTDCDNARRVQALDMFLMPVRNPDGHDAVTRTTAWGFDPNRDFGTQNQVENGLFVPVMNRYPGVFFIDAHQQGGSAYFFPPNEDPVHHEISQFSLDLIQKTIGPALQNAFNDQTDFYANYNEYDLFTPEYGDTVPSLLMGAAGMTYEKGSAQIYARQVYDHYLASDTTINVTADHKADILSGWVKQWAEAIDQGQRCEMQKNTLVSPLHDTIANVVPIGQQLCGFFFPPGQHVGDTASLLTLLQNTGVRVFKLDAPATVNGYEEFGKPVSAAPQTLPAGTLWIPLAQGTKHWIEALLEENPYIPYNYYYDVVTWSYPLQRGLAGSGYLKAPLPATAPLTELHGASFGSVPSNGSAVYAFNTDSMQGLGLVADLLGKGVNVYRGTTAFTASGTRFFTGAALVDGASLAASGADLGGLATSRNTPVTGLAGYPVAHRQMAVPKIGLYTGTATVPPDPIYRGNAGANAHCAASSGSGSFCEALFTLGVKDRIPLSLISPVTSTDLTNNRLVNEHFTAFINPGSTSQNGNINVGAVQGSVFVPNAAGLGLRSFVSGGGIYVGTNNSSQTPVRSLGMETLAPDQQPIEDLTTPGSTFDGDFDTTNPVAWGFDLGGWIYRDSSANAVFDPNSVGAGRVVESYDAGTAADPGKYGYQVQAAGLAGRPAAVDTPYGSGHVVALGYNPFFRAWKEEDERLVLNAALYPKGGDIPPVAPSAQTAKAAPVAAAVKPATPAVPAAKLRAVVSHPAAAVRVAANPDRDVRIRVKRADGRKLRSAVRAAKLNRTLRKRTRYVTTRRTVTLVVKGARANAGHARPVWLSRIQRGLDKRHVSPLSAFL
jgi:hypothetical protein